MILSESPGGSGATPAGALARTCRQDKNPLDDSTRITQGLGGSCWVCKPGVPHGPASQQSLGPADNVANDAQLLGRPKNLTTGPPLRSEGLANAASDFDPHLRPGMHRTSTYISSMTGAVGAD